MRYDLPISIYLTYHFWGWNLWNLYNTSIHSKPTKNLRTSCWTMMKITILLAFSMCFFSGKLFASLKTSPAFHLGGSLPSKFGSSLDEHFILTSFAPIKHLDDNFHGPLNQRPWNLSATKSPWCFHEVFHCWIISLEICFALSSNNSTNRREKTTVFLRTQIDDRIYDSTGSVAKLMHGTMINSTSHRDMFEGSCGSWVKDPVSV